MPEHKKPTDYVSGLFRVEATLQPRPRRRLSLEESTASCGEDADADNKKWVFRIGPRLIKAYLWASSSTISISSVRCLHPATWRAKTRLLFWPGQISPRRKYRPNAIIDSFHVLVSAGLCAINQVACLEIQITSANPQIRSLQVQIREILFAWLNWPVQKTPCNFNVQTKLLFPQVPWLLFKSLWSHEVLHACALCVVAAACEIIRRRFLFFLLRGDKIHVFIVCVASSRRRPFYWPLISIKNRSIDNIIDKIDKLFHCKLNIRIIYFEEC